MKKYLILYILLLMLFPVVTSYYSRYDIDTEFVLSGSSIPYIDTPQDRDQEIGTMGNNITWIVGSDTPDTILILRDNVIINTILSWSNGSIVVDTDDILEVRLYNYTIVANDTIGNTGTDTVMINVIDTVQPFIEPHPDVYVPYGCNVSIEWKVYEPNPLSYMVVRDITPIESGSWDGSNITVSLLSIPVGTYSYKLYLWDNSTPSPSTDIVVVYVFNTTLPFIYPVEDYAFSEGSVGEYINWTTSDDNKDYYRILVDGYQVSTSTWSSSNIVYGISYLPYRLSAYNITLVVYDDDGNSVYNDIMISVFDDTLPQLISSPVVSPLQYGNNINMIWTFSESNPSVYDIIINSTSIIDNNIWNGGDISYNFIPDDIGTYNITITVYDMSFNKESDTVIIDVFYNLPPDISGNDFISVIKDDTVDIIWSVDGYFIDMYVIYVNNILTDYGVCDTNVTYSPDTSNIGTYNITVFVNNTVGCHSSMTTILTINDIIPPPIIYGDGTIDHNETGSGLSITWTISGGENMTYMIYQDDIEISTSYTDVTSNTIVYHFIPSDGRLYNITLEIIDYNMNRVSFTTLVTVNIVTTTSTTSTTTTTIVPELMDIMIYGSIIAIIIMVAVLIKSKRSKKPATKEVIDIDKEEVLSKDVIINPVEIKRGGEFIGNKYRYKVKIINNTDKVITDIRVGLAYYPVEALECTDGNERLMSKIEPNGSWGATLLFEPKIDCVEGSIIGIVSYVDSDNEPHSMNVDALKIQIVCDLLNPEKISIDEFRLLFSGLVEEEINYTIESITPEELHVIMLNTIKKANFYTVHSSERENEDVFFGDISGWAKGKYTDKNAGIIIEIRGYSGKKDNTTARVRVGAYDLRTATPILNEIARTVKMMYDERD